MSRVGRGGRGGAGQGGAAGAGQGGEMKGGLVGVGPPLGEMAMAVWASALRSQLLRRPPCFPSQLAVQCFFKMTGAKQWAAHRINATKASFETAVCLLRVIHHDTCAFKLELAGSWKSRPGPVSVSPAAGMKIAS